MESYRVQVEGLYQRSSFYRNKLRAAGFESPRAVGGLERIAELPFTEKDELRASQAAHPPLGAHAAIEISQAARRSPSRSPGATSSSGAKSGGAATRATASRRASASIASNAVSEAPATKG